MTAPQATTLAALLARRQTVAVTGVFDALSAVLAARAGFEALFVSGSAVAMAQLARPDVGLVTLTEMADLVARICLRVDVPVLVDGDFGFGNAINVSRTVQVLEQAGASGIQLEDRVEAAAPRNLARRPVVDAAVMVDKLHAALDARRLPSTVISARTDALYSHGLDDALERAQRYVEAGADMVFVEGCVAGHDRRRVIERLAPRAPVLFNAGILKPADLPPWADLSGVGYAMVLFPANAISAAGAGMEEAFGELQAWRGGGTLSPVGFDASAGIGAGEFMTRFMHMRGSGSGDSSND
jgi:2-methylisocitrate lyase-like PEP mutase family enzyme